MQRFLNGTSGSVLDLSRLSFDGSRMILQTTRLPPSEAILAEQTEGRWPLFWLTASSPWPASRHR
jgi:hypothetical protein